MLQFERTKDMDVVRAILTDPKIWPHIGDDFAPPRDSWTPVDDERIWYVLAQEGWKTVGLFSFLPRSLVLWEVHLALITERNQLLRKTRGVEILRRGLEWMIGHSTAERIIAEIPGCNRLAVKLAEKAMDPYGVNPQAFRKYGILQDLILFGIGAERCRV